MQEIPKGSAVFESLDVYTEDGRKTQANAWRGTCHLLWIRHVTVHGVLAVAGSRTVLLQRRASDVADSPGYIDVSFAGHACGLSIAEAARKEAKEETGVELTSDSAHVANQSELSPIVAYNYVEPPRLDQHFFNCEYRSVLAIRLTATGLNAVHPVDGEVESFLRLPFGRAWAMCAAPDAANALRVSGPIVFYHLVKDWGWRL